MLDFVFEVSRSPKVRLLILGNLGVRMSVAPNMRKSRSPNVSCEVSRQIGLVIRPKPYSNGSSVIKVFALRVVPPRFKSHPRTTVLPLLLSKSC